MVAILERLLEGDLNVEDFKKYLKTGKNPKALADSADQVDPAMEFVPYFLNYIREESSHHFTPDLPVISPKKMKKRKTPRSGSTSSDTSNDSVRSSARGSLFSTPPSKKMGNVNVSPVSGDQHVNLNSSCISPPVEHQSHNSSGNSRDVSQVTSTPVKFNLDEDFPPVSSQKSSKKKSSTPTRRITPTPARSSFAQRSSSNIFNNSLFESSHDSEQSFSSFSSEKSKYHQRFGNMNSSSPKNVRRNSAKLKLEDFMHQEPRNRGKNSTTSDRHVSFDGNTSSELDKSNVGDVSHNILNKSKEEKRYKGITPPGIIPKKEQVSHAYELEILADVHSFCIQGRYTTNRPPETKELSEEWEVSFSSSQGILNKAFRENLVPNMVVEMCFVLQLLTVQGNEKTESGVSFGFFKTVHNCVYYAVHVLEKLVRIIKLLDKGTIRLLLDNSRLTEFSTSLKNELSELYPTISSNKVPYSLIKSPLNSVPFQANLDNRNNFSNDQTFHCFKKQRDTFYEIVREWEECRGKPGWSLEEKLGNKIRCAVHQKPGLANHSHFARLFQSQLIQMCCYENTLPTFNESESPEVIGNLLKSNPEKFFRLQQRLVTPFSTTVGPCPSPGFTETEEFFREFIVAAMCPSFNRYLMDSFISKIIELNNMTISDRLETSLILDQPNDDEDEKLKVKFASCLITLRTLAKFLGFLVFSPYHSTTELPQTVKDTLITTRNQVPQQLDLKFYLRKAQDERRLLLTLPWVIEYLSMMDSIGAFLDHYIEVFEILFHIYRVTLRQASSDINRSSLFLSIGLGWLFEMPAIPDTMLSKSVVQKISDLENSDHGLTMDGMDLVDQHLLYTCCPYLGELRSILADAVIGTTNKRGSVKKIKPICADKVEISSTSCRLLQTQLEDNFFRNQPEYLKKIVDFVIARIYHNMVGFVKISTIPHLYKDAKMDLNVDSTFKRREWQEIGKEGFKEKNRGLILKLCNKVTDGTLQSISNEIDKECKSRSFDVVQSLTPLDMDEVVVKTASGIVHQSTMNKLIDWSHQNLPGVIEKEIEDDIAKMITRDLNLPLTNYHKRAKDPENPFNWFYQQLIENAKESESRSTAATASTVIEEITEQGKQVLGKELNTSQQILTTGAETELTELDQHVLGKAKELDSQPTATTRSPTEGTKEQCQ